MKLGLIFAALMVACSVQQKPVEAPISQSNVDYTTPTDLELMVYETKPKLNKAVIIDVEQKRVESLSKFNQSIDEEYLQYQVCIAISDGRECKEMLAEFCRTDTYLGANGVRHLKAFCFP